MKNNITVLSHKLIIQQLYCNANNKKNNLKYQIKIKKCAIQFIKKVIHYLLLELRQVFQLLIGLALRNIMK